MGVIERVERNEGSLYTEPKEEGGPTCVEFIYFLNFVEETEQLRYVTAKKADRRMLIPVQFPANSRFSGFSGRRCPRDSHGIHSQIRNC